MDYKIRTKVFPIIFSLGLLSLILYLLLGQLSPLNLELLKNISPELLDYGRINKTSYHLEVKLDEENYSLDCNAKINYYNYADKELSEIYFFLYPKAFESTKPALDDSYWLRPTARYKPGKVALEKVTVNGHKVEYILQDTQLKVKLPQPLEPESSIDLTIYYQLSLPYCQGRYGYANQTVQCGNWYPIAAVYEDDKWQLTPYYTVGDPFYSRTADYRFQITLPREWKIAATGTLEEYEFLEGQSSLLYAADNIRDFAWAASKKYHEYVERSAKPIIRSYVWEGSKDLGRESLKIARQAMSVFNRLYGVYPYQEVKIAEVDFYQGGMEYPQIVYLSSNLYHPDNKDVLEFALVHELAHQWWYGVVGNNQVKEPWLDEALANYSTFLYYRDVYGQEKMDKAMKNFLGEPFQARKSITRPLSRYYSMNEYNRFVYQQGTWVVHDLHSALGHGLFLEVMREYYRRFSYQEATIQDFQKIVEEISGQKWHDFFQAKLYNYELIED